MFGALKNTSSTLIPVALFRSNFKAAASIRFHQLPSKSKGLIFEAHLFCSGAFMNFVNYAGSSPYSAWLMFVSLSSDSVPMFRGILD